MRYIIMGTAGHIDHGKSALVKALTGIDPDRLKEEKERGITIDLGFAELLFPDGLDVGIIDVPGHEKLIKNMLAGAGSIDIVLFVIAADEGIMPQSREHLAICDLLGIKSGIVAVTKSDLVEPDWLELVVEEIKAFVKGTFLEGADVIPVSAKTGRNIEFLKEKIGRLALETKQKSANGLFRLPIDRVFTLKGFGTVVTGTALSGRISVEDKVDIQPAGLKSKVRGLQSHGRSIQTALAGRRVALNLQGIDKDDISRGDVVVPIEKVLPTRTLDVVVTLLEGAPEVKTGSRVHLHIGAAEVVARVILYNTDILKPGEKAFCQFRLQGPVIAMSGDRFVIRRFSPLETMGGGVVLDPLPGGRRKKKDGIEDLFVYETGSLKDKIATKLKTMGSRGMTTAHVEGWIDAQRDAVREGIEELKKDHTVMLINNTLLHTEAMRRRTDDLTEMLGKYHKDNPLKPGMPKEEARRRLRMENRMFMSFLSRVPDVVVNGDVVKKKDFRIALTGVEEEMKEKIYTMIKNEKFKPPMKEDLAGTLSKNPKEIADILKILSKEGRLVRINDSLYLTRDGADAMLTSVTSFFAKKQEMSVSEFRDILDTSRKYALPYLEYLDTMKITMRVGEVRKLLKK